MGQRVGSTDEVVESLLPAPGFATPSPQPSPPLFEPDVGRQASAISHRPLTQPPPSLVQLLGHRQSLTPELLHGSLSVFPPCSAYCPPPTIRSKEGAPVCALPGSTPALVLFSLPILLFVSSFLAPFVPRCSLPPLLMAPLSVSIHAPHPPPPHLSSGWAQEQRTGVVSF